MVRLFRVYYPLRVLALLVGEAVIVSGSFLLATVINFGLDSYLVLSYENGLYKILAITGTALLLLYYFDLYDLQRLNSNNEIYFRLFMVLSTVSFLWAGIAYFFPELMLGKRSQVLGLVILTVALLCWRSTYSWIARQPYFRERVYVLGTGDRARTLVQGLRARFDLGVEVVGWAGELGTSELTREAMRERLLSLLQNRPIDRVITAMSDRRGSIPVDALLELRVRGVKVEDATALLEKTSGKIGIDGLYPSWLIFSDGFNTRFGFLFLHRLVSMAAALLLLVFSLPLIPLIALVIKLSSAGPVFYHQRRVGINGTVFTCFKFRTMCNNAEADTGPTWAGDDDPRITRIGNVLRWTRLDEIPQLWNVLRGDMAFVGPRPERPAWRESRGTCSCARRRASGRDSPGS
jgi:hypothetical protein